MVASAFWDTSGVTNLGLSDTTYVQTLRRKEDRPLPTLLRGTGGVAGAVLGITKCAWYTEARYTRGSRTVRAGQSPSRELVRLRL